MIELEQVSDNYLTDPADLFAFLYDALPERLFAENEDAEGWLYDGVVADIASLVEGEVAESGRLSLDSLNRFAIDVEDQQRGCFAVLLGLDRSLQQADPETGTFDS